MDVKKLMGKKMDRRQVLGNLGMMGAGAVLTACGTGVNGQDPDPDPSADYDAAILNFALNLEYLEAAFYLAAVGRLGELPGYDASKIILPEGYTGTNPEQSLYPDVGPTPNAVAEYAQEIASDELAHVNFLRTALGSAAATLPTIDLNGSFQAAATVASSLTTNGFPFAGEDFNPFANDAFFLHGAFIFEDVGVTAYKGAAKYITSSSTLEAAAGILAAEAYHAGTVRTYLYGADKRRANLFVGNGYPADGLDTWTILRAISDARDSLDGDSDLDQGVVGNDELDSLVHEGDDQLGANIVPTDDNGITFSRTPRQVANVVFLNGDNSNLMGGFFPDGLSIPSGLESDFEFLLSL